MILAYNLQNGKKNYANKKFRPWKEKNVVLSATS